MNTQELGDLIDRRAAQVDEVENIAIAFRVAHLFDFTARMALEYVRLMRDALSLSRVMLADKNATSYVKECAIEHELGVYALLSLHRSRLREILLHMADEQGFAAEWCMECCT